MIQYFLHAGLITNIIKLLTGRKRPLHLGINGSGFEPFYNFAPGMGDFSFPSGHVAIAMILVPCVFVFWRYGQRATALGAAAFTLTWAGSVAYGRVIYGAHFTTDVIFSIGLGIAIAPISVRIGTALLCRFTSTNK